MNNSFRLVILLALAAVVTTHVLHRSRLEEGLLRVIEKCKNGDVQSLPIALPSLKALKLPPMNFNYDGYTLSTSEVKIKGLEEMSVEKLTASESNLRMSIELNIPTLAIRADRYHLQGETFFGLVSIDDTGIFKANIHGLSASADVQFGSDGGNTVITNLNLEYSVDDVQAYLSGSSTIVNNVVNSKISDMVNDASDEMSLRVRDLITEMANSFLQGYTPDKLIEIISRV